MARFMSLVGIRFLVSVSITCSAVVLFYTFAAPDINSFHKLPLKYILLQAGTFYDDFSLRRNQILTLGQSS